MSKEIDQSNPEYPIPKAISNEETKTETQIQKTTNTETINTTNTDTNNTINTETTTNK